MSALSHQFRAGRVLLSASLICALSIPALAGDGAGKSAATPPDATPATATNANSVPPKPDREKKIYTNEDVEALARNYGVSIVGDSAASNPFAPAGEQPIPVTQSARTPKLPPEQDPVRYAQQYVSLAAQIDDIDDQVQRLRNFRASDVAPGSETPNLTVGLGIYAPCDGITTDAQIEQLLQQRAELDAQISGLEDRARINGIAPGVLYRAPEFLLSAENPSPLTPQQQLFATREALETLQSQLAEIRDTETAMHRDAAAQHITLIPETKFGGGFTADYLKQLSIQQSETQQQLSAVEDTARHQGIPSSDLP